jgi:hypothetical protein
MGMLAVLGAAPLAPVLSMMNFTICKQGKRNALVSVWGGEQKMCDHMLMATQHGSSAT